MLTQPQRQFYQDNGFVLVPGLFSPGEVENYLQHFMTLRRHGPQPMDDTGIYTQSSDPLKQYPRLIQTHRWDPTSLRWLVDERLNACLTGLLGREPFGVQTMVYFKPPGSRGQALHQDNYYLRAAPGSCLAAWMALDRCDEDNGCMQVVPGSHKWSILCTEKADTRVSFTDITVPLPPDTAAVPVIMDPGDVLFFHGAIVHGSRPNTSPDRFRRALIGHYIEGQAEQVSKGYQPAYRMDGTPLELEPSNLDNGVCGVWVEQDGTPVIEMSGQEQFFRKYE
jgi:phytanoyl-CoA hydroxylase